MEREQISQVVRRHAGATVSDTTITQMADLVAAALTEISRYARDFAASPKGADSRDKRASAGSAARRLRKHLDDLGPIAVADMLRAGAIASSAPGAALPEGRPPAHSMS